jgi:hypothetical protein
MLNSAINVLQLTPFYNLFLPDANASLGGLGVLSRLRKTEEPNAKTG